MGAGRKLTRSAKWGRGYRVEPDCGGRTGNDIFHRGRFGATSSWCCGPIMHDGSSLSNALVPPISPEKTTASCIITSSRHAPISHRPGLTHSPHRLRHGSERHGVSASRRVHQNRHAVPRLPRQMRPDALFFVCVRPRLEKYNAKITRMVERKLDGAVVHTYKPERERERA